MIIKSFVGESSSAALKLVRAELGGEAVILKTRHVLNANGGYDTEVTACLDRPAPITQVTPLLRESGANRKMSAPVWNRVPLRPVLPVTPVPTTVDLSSIDAKLENLLSRLDTGTTPPAHIAQLRDLDLPDDLVNRIATTAGDKSPLAEQLQREVASRLSDPLQFQPGDRVLVIGMAGSGKTTIVSKLAAQLVARKQRVTITGLHQQKIGAIDELQSIADLIGAEYPSPVGTDSVKANDAVTLIDCGTTTLSADELSSLNPTHTLFVFAATTRTADLMTVAAGLSAIPVTGLVMTGLDQTHRLGAMFALCDALGAPLSLVSNCSIGADSLFAPSDSTLATQMLAKGDTDGR